MAELIPCHSDHTETDLPLISVQKLLKMIINASRLIRTLSVNL